MSIYCNRKLNLRLFIDKGGLNVEYFTKIFQMWQVKLFIGSILVVFSPFKEILWILLVFIIIDTVTGCCNAIKSRKFSSKRFRKGVKKIITYSTSIVVVRLLEVGIAPLIQTNMITRLITTFLILTEAISILENLTMCGVPLPPGILRLILESLNFQRFYDIFGGGFDRQRYIIEIDEIIRYQVPLVKSEYTQKLLKINFEEWENAINFIDNELSKNVPDSNDLLFYRLSGLINSTNNMINDKWIEEEIPKGCIDNFNISHEKRVKNWINDIKEICYKSENNDNKRKAIIERTIITLYQTVIDAQKGERLN
jgi:toxin secretion/phage lysis holin